MDKQPIGIFDSGLGGLTVLQALRREMPHENFIYFGDTANVPYGSKSKNAVIKLSLAAARFLEQEQVKLIVVACNTASAQALPTLQKTFKIPIFGVIESGVTEALSATRNKRVAVLGTEGTIRSKAYEKALKKLLKDLHITAQACPLFVPLVEEGWTKTPAAKLIAQTYLKSIQISKADTVILGCTHYPILKPLLSRLLGKKVTLVDPADTLARTVQNYLSQKNNLAPTRKGKVTLYSSDDPSRFKYLAEQVLGEKLPKVYLKKPI